MYKSFQTAELPIFIPSDFFVKILASVVAIVTDI